MNALPYSIAEQFSSAVLELTPLGNGLINDTFLVITASKPFVLQRINSAVFPLPQHIITNLLKLTGHLAQKDLSTVRLKIPALLKSISGQDAYQDKNQDYWRALDFIDQTLSLESLTDLNQAQQVGFALGHFHRLVSDIEPTLMQDTLPGFHITPHYFQQYQTVLTTVKTGSEPESDYCAAFIKQHQVIINHLELAKAQGVLKLRIIHGDPKLNNFLFNADSTQIISLIDLDTVQPGLVHYDIGDCLRSCCHISETNHFDLTLCEVILKSYLAEAQAFFSSYDYQYLFTAIQLIPFELGLRFYTDYLEGNKYFKVTHPHHNLERAVAQFELCESILAQETAIKDLITHLKA
jgi:Ser/Thr protein kinase RdoA (MazF antagonist)